jgi:hypothetical protein
VWGGTTLWIELKSSTGVLKEAQVAFQRMLLALDHKWYKVKSYKRFLEILEEHNRKRR